MSNPFEALGWSDEDTASIEKEAREIKKPVVRDKRICICGHAASAHASQVDTSWTQIYRDGGFEKCKFAKLSCPCKSFVEALTVQDVRVFTFTSVENGVGANHALTRGAMRARDKGQEITWSNPQILFCLKCGVPKADQNIVPVAIMHGRLARGMGENNVFLCKEHANELGAKI